MAQLTDAQLQAEAIIIRNETEPRANTANRVGTMLVDLADSKLNKNIDTALTLTNALNIQNSYIQLQDPSTGTTLLLSWNNEEKFIRYIDAVDNFTTIKFANLATNNDVTIPKGSGVIALTVNSITADANGNINVPSKLPINSDINLSANDLTIASSGVFMIVNAGTGAKKIIFPNPADYLGLTIMIINNTASSAPISTTYQPLLRGTATAVTTIATGEMWQFISNGAWRGGKLS